LTQTGSRTLCLAARFALKQYLDLPHTVIDTCEGQQTPVDQCLTELGLKRRAWLRLPFFVTILTIARTDLILTLPRRLAKIIAPIADVRVVELPHEIKGFPTSWRGILDSPPSLRTYGFANNCGGLPARSDQTEPINSRTATRKQS
jgi:hypothetical protein